MVVRDLLDAFIEMFSHLWSCSCNQQVMFYSFGACGADKMKKITL
jgi:hypothetical protein